MQALSTATPAPLPPPALALKLMSDERLARWAAKGCQQAFAVIFERHHQALHRYCQSIVGNGHDAADALQNTMIKALRALPGEKRTIALKPWLYRIAHNESISLLRARRPDSELEAAAHVGGSAVDTIAESRERLRDLTGDLQELTEQQRGTLLMRELGGLEFDEISGALQISATAAKQSVYEARCAMQSLQEGRGMDCDVVRRTLSDGDRRTLRNLKLRGHLRGCGGCRDFETALRHRPAHLAALAPPLPLAAAASMLHGLLGAGTGAGHGGGGLLAGIAVGAKSSSALSLGAAKVASVVVIAGAAAGGAAYVASEQPAKLADSPHVTRQTTARSVAPPALGGRASDRASGRSAPGSGSTESSSDPSPAVNAGSAAAPAALQRPRAEPAPAPAAARPSPPTVGAAPQRARDAIPAGARERGAPPSADSPAAPAAPAAAAYAPPARPAAATAPEAASVATTQSAAAPMIAAPATARQAPEPDLADAVVPVVAPPPR